MLTVALSLSLSLGTRWDSITIQGNKPCCAVVLEVAKKNMSHANELQLQKCILYRDHVTNKEVCAKIQQVFRVHKVLLTIIKLRWYRNVSRLSGLAKTIFQGTVKGG